jgi:pyruvate dehydrogenase E2 component (dihydrolipoamide acetyltransferase)
MADEAGIDLAAMAGRGSGPEGRVVKADVERLISSGELTRPAAADAPAAAQSAAPSEGEIRELTPMLKAVATRMAQSKQTVPHFYVESEIDMTRAMQLRAELNSGLADSGDKISVNDLIVRASALALIQHPQAHRSYVDGKHVYHTHANVGIAVALDDGLIVPVLNEADTKPVREISRETRDLAGAPAPASSSNARSRAPPSRSPTWACSTSPTSRRSSTRPSRRSSRSAPPSIARWSWTGRSSCARSCA